MSKVNWVYPRLLGSKKFWKMNNKRFMAEGGFEPANPEAVSGCGHEIFINNVGWYVQIT